MDGKKTCDELVGVRKHLIKEALIQMYLKGYEDGRGQRDRASPRDTPVKG